MILPTKHLRNNMSLIYIGGIVHEVLNAESVTIDQLWHNVKKRYENQKNNGSLTFDWFILALNMLYIVGVITQKEGRIILL